MPRLSTFTPLLAAASLVSALPAGAPHAKRQVPTEACATGVHVISAGGDGAKNIGSYGLSGSLVDGILAAINGSTSSDLAYDKGSSTPIPQIRAGSDLFTSYIVDYHNACPDTKLVLVGYSLGAYIAMNTLCGGFGTFASTPKIDSSYADYVIGTIIYGDLSFVSNQFFDVGTCTTAGRFPRTNIAACEPFTNDLRSYCDFNDPQCCVPGTDDQVHFGYPDKYNEDAINFIVGKYIADVTTPGISTSTVPTATASSTPTSAVPTSAAPTSVAPTSVALTSAAPTGVAPTSVAPTSVPTSTGAACGLDLVEPFEFPHLIVPVSSANPDTAYGTAYNGQVDSTTDTIFNFDIPYDAGSQTCSLLFFLPNAEDLTTSSYTASGDGVFHFTQLSNAANAGTTFNTLPSVAADFGTQTLVPGNTVQIASGPCAPGTTISYNMASADGAALTWFQNYGQPPIGLFVKKC